MSALVLGTAIRYTVDQLTPFVISIRKHYQGRVALLVDTVSDDLLEFFRQYNIEYYKVELENRKIKPLEIFNIRHREYLRLVETIFTEFDRMLITDVRDVFFQDNPFKHLSVAELEFFAEPMSLSSCEYNSGNIKDLYGDHTLSQIGSNLILCAGTTIGTRNGILKYLKLMLAELHRLAEEKGRLVEDQAPHNYLIYNNYFPNHVKYYTGEGPVATLHHQRSVVFNKDRYIINKDSTVTPIIHQWDRLKDPDKKQILEKILEQ
jgi:hypothetical protein